ncbi:acetylcholinesterase-1-like isoform X2 [Ornithodoros turicata]|uniref:acetylcholinesterase-1-like isoform X2 n=1 Tax=Ornithodoros turicata TaxID=34597 RepID=UPI003138CC35
MNHHSKSEEERALSSNNKMSLQKHDPRDHKNRVPDGRLPRVRQGSTISKGTPTTSGHSSISSRRESLWDTVRERAEAASSSQAAFEDTTRCRCPSEASHPSYQPHVRSPENEPPRNRGTSLAIIFLVIVTILALLYYVLRTSDSEHITVEAKWSSYRGLKSEFEGKQVFTFLGIPYGADTSGSQRFREPHIVSPPEALSLDVTKQQPSCIQARLRTTRWSSDEQQYPTSEDCLRLNVWTPSMATPMHTPKTVLVFLYSIDFKWGSNRDYDATPLSVLGDIVVVIPNYRLHALGYLGNGSGDAPGNMALYDQLLALRWVRENIASFGGNASSIVLHGYESGAVSIGYHMLSPMDNWVKNFPRLILQSGSPYQLLKANTPVSKVLYAMGCTRGGWECLRGISAERFATEGFYHSFDYRPASESNYLPVHPQQLLENSPIKNKQVLLGNVLDEGSFLLEVHKLGMNGGVDMQAEAMITVHVKNQVRAAGILSFDSIRQRYVNETTWVTDIGNAAAKEIFGDVFFNCPVQYLAEHLAEHGSTTYKYVWAHKPSFGPWAREDFGPTQYDDLGFVFGRPLLYATDSTAEEAELSRRTINLVSDFAKTGSVPAINGTPWPQYSQAKPVAVVIHTDGFSLSSTFRAERCSFLREYIIIH